MARELLVGGPELVRTFAWAATGLLALQVLIIVGSWTLNAVDLPQPSHAKFLLVLQAVVGVGVVLAAVNGYLSGGLLVGMGVTVAPTVAISVAMLVGPALGITTGDQTMSGAAILAAYFLLLATVLGAVGFAVGAAFGWLVAAVAV